MPVNKAIVPACPLCAKPSSPGAIGVRDVPGYSLRHCVSCDLIFSEPMTPAGADWYESSEIYSAHKNRDSSDESADGKPDWRAERMFAVLSARNDSGPSAGGGRLLDIGCGDGRLVSYAAAAGWEAHGFDINPSAVGKASRRAGCAAIIKGDFNEMERLPYEKGYFDVVSAFDVLEHAASPLAVTTSAAALLAKGGHIFAAVPNLRRSPRVFDDEIDAPPHHLTIWSEKALSEALLRAGFDDIKVYYKPLSPDEAVFHVVRKLKNVLRRSAPAPSAPSSGPRKKDDLRASARALSLRKSAWSFLTAAGTLVSSAHGVLFPRGGFMIMAHGRKK